MLKSVGTRIKNKIGKNSYADKNQLMKKRERNNILKGNTRTGTVALRRAGRHILPEITPSVAVNVRQKKHRAAGSRYSKNRLSIGKTMTWQELVKAFPDKWVILNNVEKDGSTVISGKLVAVCSDKEVDERFLEFMKAGKHYTKRRTTDIVNIGAFL